MKKALLILTLVAGLFIASCNTTDSTTQFQIALNSSPSEGGTVTPATGSYDEGNSLDISATPNEGWRFVKWTGDHQGNNSTATITVDVDKSITAVFEKKTYDLTITTTGEGSINELVLTSKAESYEHGTTVELTANAETGWEFVKWEGDLTGTENPQEITVDNAKAVTAVFEKKSYDLTVITEGEGSVDEQIVTAKATNYEHGTIVELTANAASGWEFVRWEGDLTGTENPQEITVDNAKAVTAVFEKKTYDLTVITEGEGSVDEQIVTAKATNYEHGTIVELTGNAASGWEFVRWEGDLTGSENPKQITVDNAKAVTAVFEKQSFAVTITTTGQGTVTKNPDQATNYEHGTIVELTANAASGWEFVRWEDDLTGSDNPKNITVDNAKSVTAVFEKQSFAVTITTTGQGTVTKNPDQATNYEHGTIVELTANAETGWEFVKWEGDLTGSDNPQEITVNNAKSVTAVFEKQSFALTINITGQGAITKTPDQTTYEYGSVVEITATPDNDWQFEEWQGDATGNNNPIQLTIDTPKELTAIFTEAINLFYLAENGVTIKCDDANVVDTGVVNGITYTKRSAEQITTGNAETTCTSSITNMSYLFLNVSAFNEDISSWDVSSVTDMGKMFVQARAFNGVLNNWDVSNVTDMRLMFAGASSFNKDLSSWDVSSVTNMSEMFSNAESFNSDIGDWEVSNVTNMEGMFQQALIFNGDLNNWDVSSVTDMSYMFKIAETFNQDLNNWNISSVMNMGSMFWGALSFNQNLDNWDVSNVEIMAAMFRQAVDFNGNIGSWDVSSATDMTSMFWKASSFDGDLSSWDVSNVTNVSYMFYQASSFRGDLSGWCVSQNPTNFGNWFASGSKIARYPVWGTCPGS